MYSVTRDISYWKWQSNAVMQKLHGPDIDKVKRWTLINQWQRTCLLIDVVNFVTAWICNLDGFGKNKPAIRYFTITYINA